MQIRSIASFLYSLDHNVIIIIMQSNLDVNEINGNFQVFFRPKCCYNRNHCSYTRQCGCKSDQ